MNREIMTPPELEQTYEYIRIIGEGANGKTWLARKIDDGALVAVKALKLSKSENLKSYELFMREAEVLKSIDLDGVPRFYQSIFTEGVEQTCYLIQEFVDSPSLLSQIEAKGRFSERETLSLMLAVAQILHSLHSTYSPPIIHRDIKPSNILCEFNQEEVYKVSLIDFGAVANPQKKSGGSTVAGTFGYMAPEQMLGDVVPQADYYALGATALHMITGLPPYEIPTSIFVLDFESIIRAHAPETSEHFVALLHILLNPDVQQRPRNSRLLLNYIRNVRKQKPPVEVRAASICDEYVRGLRERQDDEACRVISDGDLRRWFISTGLVRAVVMLNEQPCAEYTFEIDNECFAGICPICRAIYEKYCKTNMPVFCTVRYDPADPHFNLLTKIQNDERK